MSTEIESLLRQVNAKLDSTSADFSRQAEAALAEAKNAGALSASTKAAVDQIATQHNGLKAASERLAAQLGEVEQAIAAIPSAGGRGEPSPTAGELVIAHEPMKAFASAMEGGRRISVPIPRAALLSTDLAPGVIEPQRIPGIDVSPKRRLFLRDLIASGATTSPAIWWVRMTGFTNAARVVREGQAKPYSGIEFTPEMTGVATIAHLFKMSKQIMDDMSQLMSTVDLEMKFGLDLAEEQELLFGDGTAGHLHGIVPQATPFQAAFDVEKQTGIDDMRLAMLQAQLARVPATGHVMHFVDWAKIELAKDTLGRYILANPAAVTGPTLWGLPVVPTEAPGFLGNFLTGSFEYGAQYFQREEANFVISTENADDFEKNMITGRCEKRGALAVRRPEAFIFGEFTPPVVTPPQGG